jgi:beta-galactosidase
VTLSDGESGDGESGTVWSERLRAEGAEVVASYADGPLAGLPAITRNTFGNGVAWYVSTSLGQQAHDRLIARVLAGAGVPPVVPGAPPGLEAVRRQGEGGRSWLFVLNHTGGAGVVEASGVELLSGRRVTGPLEIAPGGVAVVREDRPAGVAEVDRTAQPARGERGDERRGLRYGFDQVTAATGRCGVPGAVLTDSCARMAVWEPE